MSCRSLAAPVLAKMPMSRIPVLLLFFTTLRCSNEAAAPVQSDTPTPQFTSGSGTTSTLLARAAFQDAFNIKRVSGDWEVEIEAKPALDVAVQRIVFPPESHSGWHTHPGPVFILVKTGTVTFYEADDPTCTPIVRTAGQGYLDLGEHAHIARNEGVVDAENIVTYLAPPGAQQLRIDAADPGHCSF